MNEVSQETRTEKMAKLLSLYGFNRSKLAGELGVSPQAVASAYRKGFFSNPLALRIEVITKGQYKAVELCKDSH